MEGLVSGAVPCVALITPAPVPVDVPPTLGDDDDDPSVGTLTGEAKDTRILSRKRMVTG